MKKLTVAQIRKAAGKADFLKLKTAWGREVFLPSWRLTLPRNKRLHGSRITSFTEVQPTIPNEFSSDYEIKTLLS